MQLALPHDTVVACCWHLPPPSQLPVLPHGLLLDGAQAPCGSAVPAGTFAQVPALPDTLQAWQVPQEGAMQQTPSTQVRLAPHSEVMAQA